ncbi:HAD family phosphatase [Calidifontibacter sp. DB0510]|uniref:HAD family phosphatase n=1 Tax=Metallococcus carri TaxID=1656884 RepID=A0A967E9A8_9MICO|nr:HAD family phosphatase [Metallococcus carri]NHN55005.1 HAD family phosphatase [Metallococcus carri]NOP37351.1 HAD family phosphatase [Calidifontibacter sp. DB2511S]
MDDPALDAAELADLDDPRFAPSPPAAVVFDLGNVLIRWDPQRAIAAEVGDAQASAFLDDFDFHGFNLEQDAGRPWAEAIAEATDTHPHYERELTAYRTNFGESVREPIEGTVAILRELHSAGVRLFALTNWSEETFPEALKRHDFLELFDDIVVSGEEGVVKPDPEIYEVLAERLQHVAGLEDCVFIDDSLANVQGAMLAGLDAVQFTDPDTLRSELRARGLPLKAS